MKKIIAIILICILFIFIIDNISLGFDTTGLGDLEKYAQSGDESVEFKNMVNRMITFIQIIGSITSVVAIIVIGIKYMLGGLEEKAEYKKTMIPYIIGAVLLFAITNITKIVYDVAKDVF